MNFKESVPHIPRSTETGIELEELNLSANFSAEQKKKYRNPFRSFFCFCFPHRELAEKGSQDKKRSRTNTGDFQYLINNMKMATVSEELERRTLSHGQKYLKKQTLSCASELWRQYPNKTLFFLEDAAKTTVFIARISEIEFLDEKSPYVKSKKTTITRTRTETEKELENIITNISDIKSSVSMALLHIAKRLKNVDFCMILASKEPESSAIHQVGFFIFYSKKLMNFN